MIGARMARNDRENAPRVSLSDRQIVRVPGQGRPARGSGPVCCSGGLRPPKLIESKVGGRRPSLQKFKWYHYPAPSGTCLGNALVPWPSWPCASTGRMPVALPRSADLEVGTRMHCWPAGRPMSADLKVSATLSWAGPIQCQIRTISLPPCK